MISSQAPLPNILSLYTTLRSQLAISSNDLDDSTLAAMQLVGRVAHDITVSIPIQTFLFGLVRLNPILEARLLEFLRRSPMILIENEDVICACAKLLSLSLPQQNEDIIWSAVTNLLSLSLPPRPERSPASPITPPKRRPSLETGGDSVDDTPFHANSGLLFSDSAQTHAQVDPYLRAELRDTVLRDVQGFHSFFPGITQNEWNCCVRCPTTCSCEWNPESFHDSIPTPQFTPFPFRHLERTVVDWFKRFNQHLPMDRAFDGSGTKPLQDSDSVRQCDIFLAPPMSTAQARHSWHEVLIPGELKASTGKDCTADTIVQLAAYVREVFGAQANRRFVHAFTICGSWFRCYLFDRAGVSISNYFDISKNDRTYSLLVRILLGYATMSLQQLGFDTNYTTASGSPFIPTPSHPNPIHLEFNGLRFKLKKKLFHRPGLVSRGTLCWLAEDEFGVECVVKDSWRAGWRTSEGELLTIAGNQGVWGLPQSLAYGDVKVVVSGSALPDCICGLRASLSYTSATRIPLMASTPPASRKRGSVELSSNKSKLAKVHDDDDVDLPSSLNSGRIACPAGQLSCKTAIESGRQTAPGRGTEAAEVVAKASAVAPLAQSPLKDPEKPFVYLTHSLIVSTPIGKRIDEFASIRELLLALRDAIRCHQSLVEDGNILHRDVSPNNIMISWDSSQGDTSPKGFLIDLDLAKQINPDLQPINDLSSTTPHRRTGTMIFMAIEVLKGSATHTWRHDLESFFYVLIWLCITVPPDRHRDARQELYASWSVKDAANNKIAQMTQDVEFHNLLALFAPIMVPLSGLCEQLRDLLFPAMDDGRGVFTRTLKDRTKVYQRMIQLFNRAIDVCNE